jgi:hypothetical protein
MSKPNSKKIKTKSKHHHILFKQRAKELKASRPLPAKAKAHLREKETIDQASSECTSTEQDREVETGSANHKSSVASSINYVAKRKRKNGEDMSKLVFLKLGEPFSHMIDEREVASRVRNWSVEQKSSIWAEKQKKNEGSK